MKEETSSSLVNSSLVYSSRSCVTDMLPNIYYYYLTQEKLVICEQCTFGKKLHIVSFGKSYVKPYKITKFARIFVVKHAENIYNKSCYVNRKTTIKKEALWVYSFIL